MIAGLSKAINQYLAPLLLLTSLLLIIFAYLAPNVMLATQVALLTVTPSASLTQPDGTSQSIDGPSVFLGALGSCERPSGNASVTCTLPTVSPKYDLTDLPSNAPDLLSAPTATTPAFIAVSLAFTVIFFFLFTFTALRSKLGKAGVWFDRPMVQRSTAWIGLLGFMLGLTSFLVIRMWFGKAVEDFNAAILEGGKNSPQLVAATSNGFVTTKKYGSDFEDWSDSNIEPPSDYYSDYSDPPKPDSDDEYIEDRRPVGFG
ncbi:hypothetical protein EIP86_002927 [Pleurotus ostreatoroseus]|nr:hypothetical protein EIP86_002927 [Pleurotus ostreatoroseus]